MNVKNTKASVVLALLLLVLFLGCWQMIALSLKNLPGPVPVAKTAYQFLSDPFYDDGPNDKGIGTLTLFSVSRLTAGFVSGSVVAITLGVILGLNQVLFKAVNPYIQVLRAISP